MIEKIFKYLILELGITLMICFIIVWLGVTPSRLEFAIHFICSFIVVFLIIRGSTPKKKYIFLFSLLFSVTAFETIFVFKYFYHEIYSMSILAVGAFVFYLLSAIGVSIILTIFYRMKLTNSKISNESSVDTDIIDS